MIKPVLFALAASLALTACDTMETSNQAREGKKANVAPEDILVTEDSLSGRSFEPLGELKVTLSGDSHGPTREAVIEELRRDAAKLGANAVISVRISGVRVSNLIIAPFFPTSPRTIRLSTRTGTGTAVRLAQ